MKPSSLDYWRNYFRTANSDIFGIIDYAIMVAASDCPKEFRMRRDRIAERLFSSRLTRCSGCNHVEVAVAAHEVEMDGGGGDNAVVDDEDDDECADIERDGCEFGGSGSRSGSKESKVNSSDDGEVNLNENDDPASNYSYELEALTDEIEEESQIVGEVLRIKGILLNCKDETNSALFESLRRLQLMGLTVDTLKATEIGKAVNGLRKHGLQQIRHLARTLIDDWKVLVDEWYSATKDIRVGEGTSDSVNPSVVDEEEGLPSPPLDEGAFFATQPTSMELSQFFDGMDDDGNPRNSGEFNKNRGTERKAHMERQNIMKKKQQGSHGVSVLPKDNKNQQPKRQEAIAKPIKPSLAGSGHGRSPLQSAERKANNGSDLQKKTNKINSQREALSSQVDKLKCYDEDTVRVKLEVTKRKLQESYQHIDNAKKQRTIQVMDLRDLPKPKQGFVQRNPHTRPGNHNRNWAQGRR